MNDLELAEEMRCEFEKEQREKQKQDKNRKIEFILFMPGNKDMASKCDTGVQILTKNGHKHYSDLVLNAIKDSAKITDDTYDADKTISLTLADIKPKMITANYPLKLKDDPRYDTFLIQTIRASMKHVQPQFRMDTTIVTATIPTEISLDDLYIINNGGCDDIYDERLIYYIPMSYLYPKSHYTIITGQE